MSQVWLYWLHCANTWCGVLVVALTIATGTADPILAQIVPDDTLGDERSHVTPNEQVRGDRADRIDGGAARGTNLFHSFREFNVGEGQRVYFANPDGIENILSRVTGSDVSDIMGTLGVDGAANLFLLNPNGIIFGSNARLDVSGSFIANAGDRFTFPDGSEFSATNPQAPPLLTVSVPVGLQYGANLPGNITSAGNLAVGQDLTLAANNLTLQGQLQAGRNLTLHALNTLQIRDSVTNPFVAASGNQMLIQGDRIVDIFAVNHSNSGLVSGGDMVLRSASQVGGDAHYWSGGNFRIEQLNGSLGGLYSPYDPVIRSLGDVRFLSYFGNSLHILAAGSVTIGVIQIQAPEGEANPAGFIKETVLLSDGSNLIINGSSQPTLDIRAGVSPERIGISEVTGIDTESFSFLRLTGTPTNANITIADIQVINSDGLVFLTNQYVPNPSLSDGNITITGGFAGIGIDARGRGGSGSSVILDSRDGIVITDDIRSFSNSGNAGSITLLARGNISLSDGARLNASAFGQGDAGNVLVQAGGSVVLRDPGTGITSNIGNGNVLAVGQGGNIDIRARSFSMSNSAQLDASSLGQGNAGRISIHVDDEVSLIGSGRIDPNAPNTRILNNIEPSAIGNLNTGGIEIRGRSLALTDGAQITVANNAGEGTLGDISINTLDSVSLTGIVNPLVPAAGTSIGNRLEPRSVGIGGNVIIHTGSLSLSGGRISASTFGTGDAGNVLINARDSVSLISGAGIFSGVDSGAVGNGGEIRIDANSLSVNQSFIQTIVRGASNGLPAGRGNSGNVTIDLRGDLGIVGSQNSPVFVGISTSIAEGVTQTATVGDVPSAGNIRISARDFSMSGSAAQIRSTLDLYSVGESGSIDVQARSLSMSDQAEITTVTQGQGNARNISINVTDSASLTNSVISSGVTRGGNGDSGSINFEAGSLSVTDGAQFLTGVGRLIAEATGEVLSLPPAQGNAGDVNITARGTVTFDGVGSNRVPNLSAPSGVISEIFSEIGEAGGNITVRSGSLVLRNGARFGSETNGIGRAGDISIDTGQLTLSNDAEVTASTSGQGNAGNITVRDANTTSLSRNSNISTIVNTGAAGNGGNINIDTNFLSLNSSSITASTSGNGNAGTIAVQDADSISLNNSTISSAINIGATPTQPGLINLQTRSLSLTNGATITASTFGRGNAGSIRVRDAESVFLSNGSISTAVNAEAIGQGGDISITTDRLNLRNRAEIGVNSQGTGNAGNLEVIARSAFLDNSSNLTANTVFNRGGNIELSILDTLRLRDGSQISASTQNGEGGRLRINFDRPPVDSIELDRNSRIATEATGTGDAGSLRVNTRELTVQRGSNISASAETGQAGNLRIDATDSVQLRDGAELTVEAGDGGTAGDLVVNTGQLTVEDAEITVSSPDGQAGNLTIAANNVQLDESELTARTGVSSDEEGANITLQGIDQLLFLQNGSLISAEAFEDANGGNVTIDAANGFVVATPGDNNNIIARAERGDGGRINITAQEIFGLEEGVDSPFTNDIDASSQFGTNGEITINRPDVDPSRGLAELPADVVDASDQIAQVCPTGTEAADELGEFIITGRGGLPPSPNDTLSDDNVLTEWVTPDRSTEQPATEVSLSPNPDAPIVEAQSWVVNAEGEVALVAQLPTTEPSGFTPVGCP